MENNNFEKTIYGVSFNNEEVCDVVNNILHKTNFTGVYEKAESALKTMFVYELKKAFEKCQNDGYDCREISDNIIDDITEEKALGYWMNVRNAFVRDEKPDYTEIFGKQFLKIDKWFPSSKTCSKCGNVKEKLKLSERSYKCECCGIEIDRDYNAALNIKNIGKLILEY